MPIGAKPMLFIWTENIWSDHKLIPRCTLFKYVGISRWFLHLR